MDFFQLNNRAAKFEADAAALAKQRLDDIAKPLGSLGLLEDTLIRIAGLTGSADIRIKPRTALVLCADNGVTARGVTQTGASVTATMAREIACAKSCVGVMAGVADCSVKAVDMGMFTGVDIPEIESRRIASGTADITRGNAMTHEQGEQAILTGIDLVRCAKESGMRLIVTGEMGIGNTTTSSAVAAVLLNKSAKEVTGRGAGLSDSGLLRKINAIETAITVNSPDAFDPFGVMCALGGFDIAGLCGVFIGGAIYRVPVLIDGLISAISALIASRLCPACRTAMFATHVSAEPAGMMVLSALGLKPLICAEMRLGEGTGAVCALPMLDMACAVYSGMRRFGDIGIDRYTPQGG